jgi:hypothetical protein
MSFSSTQTPTTFVCFGRGGYNKDGDNDDEDSQMINSAGRRGYNRSGKKGGRGGYNRGPDDDDEAEDGRGGYN